MAINGQGFFQVQKPDGSTAYTRDGSFSVSSEGRLVTNDGYPLQPDINIPEGAQTLTIGKDGTVTVMVPGDTQPSQIGQIELVNFLNPAGLQQIGRASCRERVCQVRVDLGGRRIIKNKKIQHDPL